VKPLKIEFAAFGSYPGEVEVDFAALSARGLFVISGDTGTGKTTVFDAISFALFGDMPLKPADDIRSHHADAGTRTYARFTFEAGGVVYVAEQTPKYERPKKSGAGTTIERASARLDKIDGNQVTNLSSGVREVASYITDLIGLDAEQFKRVMVLPQGEVQRFLLDKSTDRETLLRQLFGGAVFEAITRALKNQRDEAEAKVREVENQITELFGLSAEMIRNACDELGVERSDEGDELDWTAVRAHLTTLQEPATELENRATAARETADDATRRATEAEAAATRYDSASQHREKLKTLAENEASVRTAAEAARHSVAARPVNEATERCTEAKEAEVSAVAVAEAALAELRSEGEAVDLDFADPSLIEVTTAIEGAKSALAAQRKALGDHGAAQTAAAQAEAAFADHTTSVESTEAERKKVRLDIKGVELQLEALSDIPLDTAALETECENLEAALVHIKRRDGLLADQRGALDAEYAKELLVSETMLGYLQSEAPRMAAQLVAGEPCRVCGSTEHPNPAVADDGRDVVGHGDVQAVQKELSEAQTRRRAIEADLAAVKAALGPDVESDAADVATRLEAAAKVRDEVAAKIERRSELISERTTGEERLTALANALATLSGAEAGLQKSVAETARRVEETAAAAAGIDAATLEERDDAIAKLGELRDHHQEAVEKQAAAITNREKADELAAGALAASSFGSVAEAQAALLDSADERKALDAEEAHQTAVAAANSALKTLEEQGVPERRPDAEVLTSTASEAKAIASALEERRTKVQQALRAARKASGEYDEIQKNSAPLRDRAAAARRAHAVCQGSTDVNLLRWVLGQQLDHVAAVASQHLRRMSNGRYTIRRDDNARVLGGKGLDLTIDDAHTGRDRSPTSLSGGEQFQASLALALGLADVVSRTGSARSHSPKALFIDEGFGSLDQQALDDAIDTLHGLQEQGRMVGVITHVEAMKERLHPGIVVERRADGRGSKLIVNP
jgi:exonuclease SbcC